MQDSYEEFKCFDVVSDDSDHYYLNREDFLRINTGTEAHKKIMKEWRILNDNLPESIFVRVYEHRIDLLRAVIVGVTGTPYHDGLFLFDIAFPDDYPNHPPRVHYHSFGLNVNPILLPEGKVCLSLLNTWSGKKSEKWNPSQSTILQVLVSIQALVLNDTPFFNADGPHMLFGHTLYQKRAQNFNEMAFANSCRTMMNLLQKLPRNFESFVVGHFRERARVILQACDEYVSGRVRVGYYDEDWGSYSPSLSSSTVKVSDSFVETMISVYPRMVRNLKYTGASLRDFDEHLEVEIKRASNKEKQKRGIVNKVILRIKKVLALKNPVKNDNISSLVFHSSA